MAVRIDDVPRVCPCGKRLSWRFVEFSGWLGRGYEMTWCCPDFAPGLDDHTHMGKREVEGCDPNDEVAQLYGVAVKFGLIRPA